MHLLLIAAFVVTQADATPAGDTVPRPAPQLSPEAAKTPVLGLSSLKLMLEKGLITQAEFDSAAADIASSLGGLSGDAPTLMISKFSATFYGFVEADNIFDSTQSFNESAGGALVAHRGTYANLHARYDMSLRNSRLGFRLRAPEWHRVRASAMLEMDFLGNQAPTVSEAQLFVNPAFRIRHFMMKLETPIVDIMIGQYWQLFGWQSDYHPNTVEIQGIPGQLYARTPQIRVSKTVKSDPVTFEAAIAMMRPPQRDAATPEGQAGLRLAFNHVTAVRTAGPTGTQEAPLSIAVTGDIRHFLVGGYPGQAAVGSTSLTGGGVAVDIFVPIVPGHSKKQGNSLALTGEFSYNVGDADMYTGLSGGVGFPTVTAPLTYTPNLDAGLVGYRASTKAFEAVKWMSMIGGLQYYFPTGIVWVSANLSHIQSDNAQNLAAAGKGRRWETWADGNLFVDATPAIRLGLEYAYFLDRYNDGGSAENHRVQLSAFYMF